ncbi:MAG: lipase/acyltransferase domain-containing protein [Marinicella sp.]
MAELYQQHGTDHTDTPLVLIHGTMGSKLRQIDNHEEVWPGKINQLIFSNYKKLANEITDDGLAVVPSNIESYAIFDSYSGLSIYDEIIETLIKYGSYQLNDISEPAKPGRNLYVFHYDWRQDNVKNAQLLAQYVEQVLAKHHNHQQVDVVAHSMGGLILRYYQRYGAADVLDSIQLSLHTQQPAVEQLDLSNHAKTHLIRHAIFLGTPQLGSVKSVKRLQDGFDFNLRNIPVEVQITMPSVYQLLPHPQSNWVVQADGTTAHINVFDQKFWQLNQWSIYNDVVRERIIKQAENSDLGQAKVSRLTTFFNRQLKRAELFWHSLSPAYEVEHEGFIIMGGDCKKTLNRLIVNTNEGRVMLADDLNMGDEFNVRTLHKSLLYEPGDGQVSKSSLLGEIHDNQTHKTLKTIKIKYPVFVCEDHIKLTQNLTFQDNLLHVLLNE